MSHFVRGLCRILFVGCVVTPSETLYSRAFRCVVACVVACVVTCVVGCVAFLSCRQR